jgi:hypothetical protein
MPIDPVKIPQNVYIEDRIVGPLTLRQTLMMAGGGGFSYALWALLNKTYGNLSLFTTIMVWFPAAASVLFSLVRINDLSLSRILLLLVERMWKPPQRTFAPRTGLTIHIRTTPQKEEQKPTVIPERTTQQQDNRIRELSSILDRGFEGLEEAVEHEHGHDEEPTVDDDADAPIFRDIIPPSA